MYAYTTKNWGFPRCLTYIKGVPRCVTMCDRGRETKLVQNIVITLWTATKAHETQHEATAIPHEASREANPVMATIQFCQGL